MAKSGVHPEIIVSEFSKSLPSEELREVINLAKKNFTKKSLD